MRGGGRGRDISKRQTDRQTDITQRQIPTSFPHPGGYSLLP